MSYDNINLCNLLLSFSDALDLAHPEISHHQQRTAYIAFSITQYLNFSFDMKKNIFIAALFHDVGAISIEDKISLHNFEEKNTLPHCIKGELLLKRHKPFNDIAKIVKHHHKKWNEFDNSKKDPLSLASQILCLSDYIERLINKNENILNQKDDILKRIQSLSGIDFNPELIKILNDISKKEYFWLDISSSKLYSRLLQISPISNLLIKSDEFESITKLFKDLIDFKSSFTAAHSMGVSACAEMLGKLLGLNKDILFELKIAGFLHDLGKLMVPNSILEKESSLTEYEMNIMKCHPYYSFHLINSINGMQKIAEMAGYHHEKPDGSGYPFKLKEDELSVSCRIIEASDIFTAIIEDRPYRKGMTKIAAKSLIMKLKNSNQIDKSISEIILDNFNKIFDHIIDIEILIQEFYKTRIENLK